MLYYSHMDTPFWYEQLIKPTWAPPSWLFGPVWSVLYLLIIVSFGYVTIQFFKGKISFWIFLPFLLNIIFNLLFTPLQFGLQNNTLAAIDIALVLGTLIWGMILMYPKVTWVCYINIPYLLWVSFATILQFTITYLNRS